MKNLNTTYITYLYVDIKTNEYFLFIHTVIPEIKRVYRKDTRTQTSTMGPEYFEGKLRVIVKTS